VTPNPLFARALRAIEQRGILLVYPLQNRPEPRSLWSELYPRTPMRWTWDAGADARVARVWRLREELARSDEVVYAKWFRGRATFFARDVFRALLAELADGGGATSAGLEPEARLLLEILEDSSPQSTKELRANADLRGRANEATFARGMKELWSRLLIVGVGEVNDGAFPSLSISATRHRFEDLLPDGPSAREHAAEDARRLEAALGGGGRLFARELARTREALRASKRAMREHRTL